MKKVAALGCAVAAAFFFAVAVADAQGYAWLTSGQNIAYATSTTAYPVQGVGTDMGDTLTSIEMQHYYSATNNGNSGILYELYECTDAAYSSCTGSPVATTTRETYAVPVGISSHVFTIQLATSYDMDVLKYYKILVNETATYTGVGALYGAAFDPVYQPPTLDGRMIVAAAGGLEAVYYQLIAEFSADGVSIANATSSSIFSGQDATTTLSDLAAQCSQAGNIFAEGICIAFSFLFVPAPSIVQGYADLVVDIQGRFPVSYVAGVASAFGGLSASTTANMFSVTLPLHSIGVGSTSPLGLANVLAADVDAFSTSTIQEYIGSTYWALFQSLIALGIWLTFAADVFFTVRNKMHQV